ncbi:hypothetical protein [uncultured Acetobacterium sp.]|uniref:hypothetical protein n=1 Tax=uncultured Acetobacterium sp. TaxID=217139 RepID=UPI0024236873|nr:hypothetical protein [uncultured Acetobacterium sp.]MBU4539784.1 hypothetical protein [Bacillota bacterium]
MSKLNDDGFVLPLVLVVMALLAAGAGYALSQGMAELQANVLNLEYQLCLLTGKNAIAILQAELEEDINYSGSGGKLTDENGGSYQIRVLKVSEKLRFVEVTSQYRGYQMNFSGEVELIMAIEAGQSGQIDRFNWRLLGVV